MKKGEQNSRGDEMDKRKNERIEFLDRMIASVTDVPVDAIVGRHVTLQPGSMHRKGLCPFHADKTIGSFMVTPSKGLWKCFACGHGGNGIQFIREFFNLDFLDASFKIALDHGIIDQDEFHKFSKQSYDPAIVEQMESKVEAKTVLHAEECRAEDYVIRNVYAVMPKICGLTDEHRDHLLQKRGLKEDDLKDYFSFPTRRVNLPQKILAELERLLSLKMFNKPLAELSEEESGAVAMRKEVIRQQLRYVPGFFYNEKKKAHDFSSFKGIGLLCRDEKGRAKGIQIRKDDVKPGESRYIWFSSVFAQTTEGLSGGASSKTPGGIIFPKKNGPCQLCITEGRFKAECIAAQGNIAIYCSGVNTWKSIMPILQNVQQNRKKVFLMFDADMLGNEAVHLQFVALAEDLKKRNLRVYLVAWAKKHGKGFDDMVLNLGDSYTKHLRYESFEAFENAYQKVLTETLDCYGVAATKDLERENVDSFVETMQSGMESALELV